MKRRALLFAGAGAALCAAGALAQHRGRTRRVGVLVNGPERLWRPQLRALRDGLAALGHAESRDVVFDVRGNEGGNLDTLEHQAAELLRAGPDVIVAWPVFSARALHRHTRSVPIVIAMGAGAVEMGLAASLARPGGNVTGILTRGEELVGKRIELLRSISPRISRVALVFSGQQLVHDAYMSAARQSAASLNLLLLEHKVTSRDSIAGLVAPLKAAGCEGFVVAWDALMVNLRSELIALAARLRVPAVYPEASFAREGGLASYAAHQTDAFVRAAAYVDSILRGANPAELPIEQPTKFELIVNVKTAKALDIVVPQAVMLRADEIIS